MLSSLKTRLRRLIRGYQKSALYPVLLPHHKLTDGGVKPLHLPERELPEPVRRALSFCDGSHTLSEVAEAASASRSHIIAAQEGELILLWPHPIPAAAPTVTDPASIKTIIFSPHPDDAALSLGGRMLLSTPSTPPAPEAAAEPLPEPAAAPDESAPPEPAPQAPPPPAPPAPQTLVINVFSKSAWWRFPPTGESTDLSNHIATIQASRAAEDDLVSRLSGCPMRALDLKEALLRGHDMANIFTDPIDARDTDVIAHVKTAVTALAAEFPQANFYLPLAIGRHIDHRITRDAALTALQSADIPPAQIHFFEDIPYVSRGETSDFPTDHPDLPLTPATLDISAHMDAKLEMLRAYWSQFSWSQLPEFKTPAKEGEPGTYVERTQRIEEKREASSE